MFVLLCILATTKQDEGEQYDTADRHVRFVSLPRMFILLVLFLYSAKQISKLTYMTLWKK